MIKTNNHTGIMEMHNKKKKKEPKPPEPEMTKRQWTMEEMLHAKKLETPDRSNKYRTTAKQRPVDPVKRETDIWGGDDK